MRYDIWYDITHEIREKYNDDTMLHVKSERKGIWEFNHRQVFKQSCYIHYCWNVAAVNSTCRGQYSSGYENPHFSRGIWSPSRNVRSERSFSRKATTQPRAFPYNCRSVRIFIVRDTSEMKNLQQWKLGQSSRRFIPLLDSHPLGFTLAKEEYVCVCAGLVSVFGFHIIRH